VIDNWSRVFIGTAVAGGVLAFIGWYVPAAFFVGAAAGASFYRFLEED
jgi:hypothetical protein